MNKTELNKLSLHSLRIIGRDIGVKSVSTLNKQTLIEKIERIEQGKDAPYFSKKGRPPLSIAQSTTATPTQEQLIYIDNLINKLRLEIISIITKK